MQITLNKAQQIVLTLLNAQANNSSNINLTTVINALKNVKATTFATLVQASKVTINAHLRDNCNYYKITVQNATLCNSNASIYCNAVNKQSSIAFSPLSSDYVLINNSYSVCALKSNTNKHYLRANINKCLQSLYYCATTHKFVSKQHIASHLSEKAAAKFLRSSSTTTVKHANVTHSVITRTFSLANIYSINVAKQTLTA